MKAGLDHWEIGQSQPEEDSRGSGGAMRIAPVGLAYRHVGDDTLRMAVTDALVCTQVHPEAIDAAVVQARAIGLASLASDPEDMDFRGLLQTLIGLSQTENMRQKLLMLLDNLDGEKHGAAEIESLGNGRFATEAVAAALWASIRYARNAEECIIRAVNFGGNTGAIGAMAGALVGALHGCEWISARWYDQIENGWRGRDDIIELAKQLARLDLRKL